MSLVSGGIIKASEIADDFNSTVKNAIDSLIVWKQGTGPGPYADPLNDKLFLNTVAPISLVSLAGTLIKKDELTLTLFNMAALYTKVRLTRYHQWETANYFGVDINGTPHPIGPPTINNTYSAYTMTSLSGDMSPVNPSGWADMAFAPNIPNSVALSISTAFMSNIIKAQDIKTLNTNIFNAWQSFANSNGIDLNASYCHSSCHNACHSSCHHNRF